MRTISDNVFQSFIYFLAQKLSIFFKFLRITPNQISLFSFILCLYSCYLFVHKNISLFCITWFISHFLDYCDGTLARLTNNKTKILLRLDHTLDLIKFSAVMYCFALINNFQPKILLLSYLILFILLMKEILELNVKVSLLNKNKLSVPSQSSEIHLIKRLKGNILLKNLYNIFFTFNGHTLFMIPLLVDHRLGVWVAVYLLFLLLKSAYNPLSYLISNLR